MMAADPDGPPPIGDATGDTDAGGVQHVCFFFNAQRHQLLHGVSIAAELARRPGVRVAIVSPSQGHLDYARALVERLAGGRIDYVAACPRLAVLAGRKGKAVPPKLLTLLLLARQLNRYDAIALPERTSILLRRLGARHPTYIHLDHGAGDRAVGFDRRIRLFDFVLMAGPKHRTRLLRDGLIRPDAHAAVGYPKFEAADAARDPGWRPFAGDRPIVLYNPHFSALGSWERMGAAVLRAFARQHRYALIFAPHVRLFDDPAARARWAALLTEHGDDPNILIDPGSDRSIDMSYTMAADIYLGDVSSQVYEFLRRPRPCVFLDPHDLAWAGDENYAHWQYGPVLRSTDGLLDAIDAAVAGHDGYRGAQEAGFAATFGEPGRASERAADAILDFLARDRPARTRRYRFASSSVGRTASGE